MHNLTIGSCAAIALGVLFTNAGVASAFDWAEGVDLALPTVGPGDAEIVTGAGTLNSITGGLASGTDADLFRIYINNPAAFSARTDLSPGTLSDTQLFLFTVSGVGIAANDDGTGLGVKSQLPVGNALYNALPAGEYLIGLSTFGLNPRYNSVDKIFTASMTGGLVAGPASVSPLIEFGFTSTPTGIGTYTITLTGATGVPEPTSLAIVASLAMVSLRRRR